MFIDDRLTQYPLQQSLLPGAQGLRILDTVHPDGLKP